MSQTANMMLKAASLTSLEPAVNAAADQIKTMVAISRRISTVAILLVAIITGKLNPLG